MLKNRHVTDTPQREKGGYLGLKKKNQSRTLDRHKWRHWSLCFKGLCSRSRANCTNCRTSWKECWRKSVNFRKWREKKTPFWWWWWWGGVTGNGPKDRMRRGWKVKYAPALSGQSLSFMIQRLWRASQEAQLHVWLRVCSSIKGSVGVTCHGSAAAAVFPRNPTQRGATHSPAALVPPHAAGQRAHANSGEALGQLPGPVRKADEEDWPLLRKQLHVGGVPEHPPNQAEKNNDWARVNEKVSIEAVARTQIAENSYQKHNQAGGVKHNSKEEERSAFSGPNMVHSRQKSATDTGNNFHLFGRTHMSPRSTCKPRLGPAPRLRHRVRLVPMATVSVCRTGDSGFRGAVPGPLWFSQHRHLARHPAYWAKQENYCESHIITRNNQVFGCFFPR